MSAGYGAVCDHCGNFELVDNQDHRALSRSIPPSWYMVWKTEYGEETRTYCSETCLCHAVGGRYDKEPR